MKTLTFLFICICLVIPCSAIDDPVGHWKFDETSGDTAYDSAGSNDGTLIGDATWTNGKIGGALEFDGSGDYVNIPDSPILDISGEEITVAAWINTNNINSRQSILSKMASGNNTWMLEVNPVDWGSGKVGFIVNTSGELPSVSTITPNEWYHFVGVYNGTERKIYINGQFDASKSDTGNILTNDVPFRIGGWGSSSRYFDGKIDDVRIYDRVLSEAEIMELAGGVLPYGRSEFSI